LRWIERKRIPARSQEALAQDHNDYDGEIRFTDTQIERLFVELKRLGLYDDSLIILTADHGEGLRQHGELEHGVLYNEQLFVPLIMKFPKDRGPAGQRIDRLTSVIDVFPTALAAIDLQLDAGFDGVDVLTEERAHALSEREHAKERFGTDINYTLTGLEWKYFYHTEKPDALFHLTDDLDENRDVIDEYPDVAEALREKTLRLVHEHQQRGEGLEIKREVSPELLDALRGLGYVQ
jgi:arylsulfatase A-like enzyme